MRRSLTVEQKIKIMRGLKDFTQEKLGEVMGTKHSVVSRIENDKAKYTGEQLKKVKQLLGIEDAPLTEDELKFFSDQLYACIDLITDEHFEDAAKRLMNLSVVEHLSFEPDLLLLYRLVEIKLHLRRLDLIKVKNKLKKIEPEIEGATAENLYHYNYIMGSLRMLQNNPEEALRFFTLAYESEVDAPIKTPLININLALCHLMFGRYGYASTLLERAYNSFGRFRKGAVGLSAENALGLCYARMGRVSEAMVHFNKTFALAKAISNDIFVGQAFHNLGYACFLQGKYKEALEYLDQSAPYLKDHRGFYTEVIYRRIRCMIALKGSVDNAAMVEAVAMAEGDAHYLKLFEALAHLCTLKNESSLEYIEEITIPYLLEKYQYDEALDFYQQIQKIYKKRSALKSLTKEKKYEMQMKVLSIDSAMLDIYKKIVGREVIV